VNEVDGDVQLTDENSLRDLDGLLDHAVVRHVAAGAILGLLDVADVSRTAEPLADEAADDVDRLGGKKPSFGSGAR
jgi:hypothetical protein